MTSAPLRCVPACVAVWDVLRLCRRRGSLDSAIEPDSMVANDFGAFFDAHPAIERVFFNGAAAEKNFGRLVGVDRPSALSPATVDEPRPNHAIRGQADCLAGSHCRTSITVPRPLLRSIVFFNDGSDECRDCGAEPRAGARFCDACGAPIAESQHVPPSTSR